MISTIVAVGIILFAFYLLSIISEDFFVPAIDSLASKLNIGSDVAGATLLAMGSSAPELFTSIFAVFGSGGEHSNVGAGAIVGSAIFNVLVIIGAAAMFKAVKLQWQPVIRDMSFYVITIILLYISFRDGQVTLIESSIFVALYALYIIAVVNWRKLFPYKDISATELVEDNEVGQIGTLARKAIGVVIPDPRKKPHLYAVSFIMSILAIALLSHQLVANVVIIADFLSIDSTFLALTVLAAGTSVPDLIGSIVVAKQGRGDMAVSNAVGSNIFDVLFGLGMPWLIVVLLRGEPVSVSADNLTASVFLLFATVIALLFLMVSRNWKLGHKNGLFLIGLYATYVIYLLYSTVIG